MREAALARQEIAQRTKEKTFELFRRDVEAAKLSECLSFPSKEGFSTWKILKGKQALIISEGSGATSIPFSQIVKTEFRELDNGDCVIVVTVNTKSGHIHWGFGISTDFGGTLRAYADSTHRHLAVALYEILQAGRTAEVEPSAPSQKIDPVNEIRRYKELLDIGALTQEEFDAKKKHLLNL